MFQVIKGTYGWQIEVWPTGEEQVPRLPLMSAGQVIETATLREPFRITQVTVMEVRAPDDRPFSFMYAYRYDVIKLDA